MTTAIAATEVKTRFGHYLGASLREPVAIEKNGQPIAVMLSKQEFDRLTALEDSYWLEKARSAEKQGYLSPEASLALLTQDA